MDIIILRIIYPNDPTNTLVAHQHFVADITDTRMDIYTVSSILGKENRVFGEECDNYELIASNEVSLNGFSVPSFIDCAKMYSVEIDESMNIYELSHRALSGELCDRIRNRIEKMKREGKHIAYTISAEDIKKWNNKL